MRFDKFIAEIAVAGPAASPAARGEALAVLKGKAPVKTAPAEHHSGPPRGYTIAGAAKIVGFSTMTLRRAIAKGELRVVRPTRSRPRILEQDLAAWMEGRS
jgi:excisionase family DNA binding protein